MLDTLIKAITDKKTVELRNIFDSGSRLVEPHIAYITEHGSLLIDFFQLSGYSKSGNLPGWRSMRILNIRDVSILDTQFKARIAEGYNPLNRTRYFKIICQVQIN